MTHTGTILLFVSVTITKAKTALTSKPQIRVYQVKTKTNISSKLDIQVCVKGKLKF